MCCESENRSLRVSGIQPGAQLLARGVEGASSVTLLLVNPGQPPPPRDLVPIVSGR